MPQNSIHPNILNWQSCSQYTSSLFFISQEVCTVVHWILFIFWIHPIKHPFSFLQSWRCSICGTDSAKSEDILHMIMCVLVCAWQAAHNSTSALGPHVACRCNRDVSLWGRDEFIRVDQSKEEAPAELIMPYLCLLPIPAIPAPHDPDIMVNWQLERLNFKSSLEVLKWF